MAARLTLLALALSAINAPAAEPRFQWKTGQALTYRVSQSTTAVEALTGKDASVTTVTTQLDLVKRWQVLAVDASGTATLQDWNLYLYPGLSYRHLLVVPGGEFQLECAPPHDHVGTPWKDLLVKPMTAEGRETAGEQDAGCAGEKKIQSAVHDRRAITQATLSGSPRG